MSSYALPWRLLSRFGWQSGLEADFSRGLIRDLPRSSIPPGGFYDATDFIFDQAGKAYKRGGVAYQGGAMGGTNANLNGSKFITLGKFAAGTKVLAQANDLHLYDITSAATDLGALSANWPRSPAVMLNDTLYIAPDGPFKKVSIVAGVVTLANPTNVPPEMRHVTTYASRLVVGNDRTNSRTNRIYFSQAPDPEAAWDTTNMYLDANNEISLLQGIQGALLVFSPNAIERIIGTVPPGIDGEDMALQPFADNAGCIDGRSTDKWGAWIVFAGPQGVFMTNGSTVEPLMTKNDGTGILDYYQGLAKTAIDTSDYVFSGVVHNSTFYHLVISSGTGAVLYDHLVCHLPSRTWWRLGANPLMFWQSAIASGSESYAVCGRSLSATAGVGNRAVKLSGIYTPAAGNKNDADGTAVLPFLETRVLGEGVGLKSFGHGHLHYDMRDAASDNPTLAVTVAKGLEATTFQAVPESPLAETTDMVRKRFRINRDSQALTVRLQQSNASSKTEIFGIEFEQRAFSLSSEGQ